MADNTACGATNLSETFPALCQLLIMMLQLKLITKRVESLLEAVIA
jgi:hypothetical protein